MRPEELGKYYESILDRELRREQGIYYTPPLIVDLGRTFSLRKNEGRLRHQR